MRRPLLPVVVVALLLSLVAGRPAAAWFEDDDDWWGVPDLPEPEAFAPEIAVVEEPPEVFVPEVFVPETPAPEGVYLVTETYVRDTITVEGPQTRYGTETIDWSPGTYAREIETVGTGVASALDGAAFNGRTTLSSGEAVAGTYYENYVRTDAGFVPVSIVFFQNDAELAAAPSSPAAAPVPVVAPVPQDVATPAGGLVAPPGGAPVDAGAGAAGGIERPDEPGGAQAGAPVPSTPGNPESVPVPTVQISFAARPGGPAAARVEVLRGRRAVLWPRVTIDGAPAPALSWRLEAGTVTEATASGAGGDPFVGRWDRLAPPGGSYLLRFAVRVALPGEAQAREVPTSVEVAVLSPALAR